MTRKDYQLIAAILKEHAQGNKGYAVKITRAFADALERDSGYDMNGNRRFKRDIFLAACGVEA